MTLGGTELRAIWKFHLPMPEEGKAVKVEMPPNAIILTLQVQRDSPQLWAIVNLARTKEPAEERWFEWIGTGWPRNSNLDKHSYVGSFQLEHGEFVFHIFEVPKPDGREA